jgi:hypothetical protein
LWKIGDYKPNTQACSQDIGKHVMVLHHVGQMSITEMTTVSLLTGWHVPFDIAPVANNTVTVQV